MDNLTKEQRKKNMQAIKSSGTNIENILAKALWQKGYRYRRNCKNIIGKPDIVLRKYKLVIFCDSEFWHGKNWTKNKFKIHSNIHFWHKKIESNIKRDKFINKELKKQGWNILRFWGNDIKKNLNICLTKIKDNI
ncbi:MAG: very short patch repair endonuclease [Endomicrobiaceae bacterium]